MSRIRSAFAAAGSGLHQQHAVGALGQDALEAAQIRKRTGDRVHRIRRVTELRADHRFTTGIAQCGHERGSTSPKPARHDTHLT
jgi:hypothetical protein